MYMECKVRKM